MLSEIIDDIKDLPEVWVICSASIGWFACPMIDDGEFNLLATFLCIIWCASVRHGAEVALGRRAPVKTHTTHRRRR